MIQSNTRTRRIPTAVWIVAIAALLIIAGAFLVMNMMMGGAAPADLDYSTTRASEKGLFNVSYTASTGKVPVNQLHEWTLHVENASGEPVESATIAVNGDMPQHGHGLPTRPQVTKYLGNGDYLIEGMRFQMGGWWVVDFTITANNQTDAVHFNMRVQ